MPPFCDIVTYLLVKIRGEGIFSPYSTPRSRLRMQCNITENDGKLEELTSVYLYTSYLLTLPTYVI